ncbi:SRPBCC domain-containing protein [Streptomyces sp. NPDC002566]|uniref:SRPBCC domain-containing protein n=1 Tax=Streptomyces sp. NPDC002566 TaxID=3364650 RepID=UPI00367B314F
MEQEVFVPVPAERLRAALADPEQVARAVPGLQQDAGTEPVAGRLKLRVAGHTITYRGALRVTVQGDGGYVVEGDATEARGTGTVKLALTVRLRESEGGTAVVFEGTASAAGRIAELPSDAVDSAVARLLNRFAENLGEGAEQTPAEASGGSPASDAPEPSEAAPADAAPADAAPAPETPAEEAPSGLPAGAGPEATAEPEATAGRDATAEPEATAGTDATAGIEPDEDPDGPPAEAAHARRTMIGRSAEEVDHAPPRGRYAPVPAPETVARNDILRWAAPAAAFAVASAIVVGRALRRRR